MCCVTTIRDGHVKKARKAFTCMASDFIRESILCYRHQWKLTFSEWRSVAEMKAKHWRVEAGEPYYWQFNTAGGNSYMFKANKKMHDLCVKYDLYPCEC